MNSPSEPKLAPPGAGLPTIELLIARGLFAWRRWTGSRASCDADFQKERDKIRTLISSCDPESGAERVLIRRLPGLEDSSRYWSVWMTLDHLRIVHGGITRTIKILAAGKTPPGSSSTAAVKPSPQVTAPVVGEYEKSCDELLAVVAAIKNLNTKTRYRHPWFGALSASGWQALAGNHLSIHRAQIERILAGQIRSAESLKSVKLAA